MSISPTPTLYQLVLLSTANRRLTREGDFSTTVFRVRERALLYVAPEYRDNIELTRALVIAVEALLYLPVTEAEASGALLSALLTIGVSKADDFLRAVSNRMGCPSTPYPMVIQNGVLAVADNYNPLARPIRQATTQAVAAFHQRRLESIRDPNTFDHQRANPHIILTSLCAYVYALAAKAVSCYNSAVDNVLTRIRVMIERTSADIDPCYRLSRRMMTILAQLIRGQMTVRWVIVDLSLRIKLEPTEPWMKVVVYLSEYMQDAGIAMFLLIRDVLIVTRLRELTCPLFNSDLFKFKEACSAHVSLEEYGPYVRFLEFPQATLFQAGKFPNLVQFMRGFTSEFNPRAGDLLTGGGREVLVRQIYDMGVRAGRRAAEQAARESGEAIA